MVPDPEAIAMKDMIERCIPALRESKPASSVIRAADEEKIFRQMQLLTAKPVMYVCNVAEASAESGNEYSERVAKWAAGRNSVTVVISAAIEAEIALLEDEDEKAEFLDSLGLKETGLARVTSDTILTLRRLASTQESVLSTDPRRVINCGNGELHFSQGKIQISYNIKII